jgi:hypothetical protein
MGLKPRWWTNLEEFEIARIVYTRNKRIEQNYFPYFPSDIDATYSFNNIGEFLICLSIYLPGDADEITEHAVLDWVERSLGKKAKRLFREESGTFAYRCAKENLEDTWGSYDIIFLVENVPEVGCEIRKVTKSIEQYEAICKDTGEPVT